MLFMLATPVPLKSYQGHINTHDAGAVQGVCALTNCPEPNLVALPASATAGTICIYNLLATGVNVLCEVEAHRTPVVSSLPCSHTPSIRTCIASSMHSCSPSCKLNPSSAPCVILRAPAG